MSAIVDKITGFFVEDEVQTDTPALAWVSEQCRSGYLAPAVNKFLATVFDPAHAHSITVLEVKPDHFLCKAASKMVDHEAKSPFLMEVSFRLNPLTGEASKED